MEEEWRTLDEWPGYRVSNFGQIYSDRGDALVKAHVDRYGHVRVNMYQDPDWKTIQVHRLVALAFVEGYFDGARVLFKDDDKENVRADNLVWVTHAEMMADAKRRGRVRGKARKLRSWAVIDGVEVELE